MFFMQFGITCKWILGTTVTPRAYWPRRSGAVAAE